MKKTLALIVLILQCFCLPPVKAAVRITPIPSLSQLPVSAIHRIFQDSEGYPSTYNAAELGEGDAGLKIANPEKKEFIFEGWEFTSENGKVLTSDHSGFKKDVVISKGSYGNLEFTAKFEEDQNGDEIPDKYQIKVTYEVKNGKWNDGTNENITEVVTLTDSRWRMV